MKNKINLSDNNINKKLIEELTVDKPIEKYIPYLPPEKRSWFTRILDWLF